MTNTKKHYQKRPLILAAVMLAMFLSAIEATIVATAMPSIVADLQQFTLYSWVFSAYLLSSSATVLIFGKLADIYGRRPIFIIGILIFLIGSIMAGSSLTMPFLILSRFIQGLGAGALMPVATTIVGDIYTKEERAKIQGYLSSVWGISAIIGPLIGALFVDFLHWRYIFWMNIPLGLLAVLGIILFFKEDMEDKQQKVDYLGSFLIVMSIGTLMYILVEGGLSIPWTSPLMIGLIIVLCSSFALFLMLQKRVSEPIIPLELWKVRLIFIANITSLLSGAIMISISSYLPTFVQGVLGKSALIAGFTLTAMSVGWPLASTVSGRLLLKIGYRTTSIIGTVFLATGALLFVILPHVQNVLIAGIGSFLIGVGMGMTSTAFIVSIQTKVGWEIRGIATASNMFMRTIGSAIGVAFLGGLLNSHLLAAIKSNDNIDETMNINMVDQLLDDEKAASLPSDVLNLLKGGLTGGLQFVYLFVFIFAILCFILVLLFPKDNTLVKRK